MYDLNSNNVSKQSAENPIFSIISFDSKKHWMFHSEGENYELTTTDINQIYELLTEAINDHNDIETAKFLKKQIDFPHLHLDVSNYTLSLDDYKRQYLAVKMKEEIVVFVQCFCNKEHRNWQSEMIQVSDGGKCYFDVYINLTQNTIQTIAVNGEA